ncbi:acetate--CoA ligase family protein [Nanoarchaeota archaeon]
MNLDKFFKAKNVAIVGVSKDPRKVGHVILRNFMDGKFQGRLFIVNPNADEILNHKCYNSLAGIREPIDLAVIAVPSSIVLNVIKDCAKKRIKHVVLVTAGFEEIGNFALAKKLKALITKHKIKVIGPNCLGIYNAHNKLDAMFIPRYRLKRPLPGGISFVCQSGAVGSAILDLATTEGYRFAKFASYGNAIDVDEADLIEYLGNDPETKVICAYIEGIKQGRKFLEIAKKVSKKKPIVAIKGGTTEAGSKATLSHTGSLAGSAEVYRGVFKQAGVIQADSLEQMFNYARILEKTIPPKGDRVQVITNGGGYGILSTDAIIKQGLKQAQASKETIRGLKKQMPPIVVLKNPMDLVGDATTERFSLAIDACLKDPNIDILLVIILYQTPLITTDIVDIVIEANDQKKKPIIVVSTGGEFTEVLKDALEDTDVPCYTFPEGAVDAIRHLVDYYCVSRKLY